MAELQTSKKIERKIVIVTCLGHGLCHTYALILASALLPISENLNLSLTSLTGLGTISYLLFGLGALPSGFFIMKTNAKLSLRIFFLSSALACIFTGLSGSVLFFAAGLAMIGIFGSLYHVAGLTLISQGVTERGKILGIHGIAGSIGIAMTPLVASVIISLLGWRAVYLIMAVPGILGFLWLLFDRDIPRFHVEHPPHAAASKNQGYGFVFFILAILAMGFNGFVYRGFLTIFPTYMTRQVTITRIPAVLSGGIVSTAILLFGMIGQYFGGTLSDRFRKIRFYLFILAASLPLIVLIGFTRDAALIGVSILFSIFYFATQPVENHIISVITPPGILGSVYGIKFVLTFGIGAFAAGFSGYVSDHYQMSSVFPMLGSVVLLCIVLVGALALKDDRNRIRPGWSTIEMEERNRNE